MIIGAVYEKKSKVAKSNNTYLTRRKFFCYPFVRRVLLFLSSCQILNIFLVLHPVQEGIFHGWKKPGGIVKLHESSSAVCMNRSLVSWGREEHFQYCLPSLLGIYILDLLKIISSWLFILFLFFFRESWARRKKEWKMKVHLLRTHVRTYVGSTLLPWRDGLHCS